MPGGRSPDGRKLRVRLIDASHGNIDPLSAISPIRALVEQGCDLDLDMLPIVARERPDLPRPLKNWGAPWLVRDILAARASGLRVAVAALAWDKLSDRPDIQAKITALLNLNP